MKQIEDIEKMAWQELESAACQENAPLPEGLEQRIAQTLTARTLAKGKASHKAAHRILWTSLAAAAVLTAVLTLRHNGSQEPKDSFDDPRLAYAEIEKTFQLISQKMAEGVGPIRDVKPLAEKPAQILKKHRK